MLGLYRLMTLGLLIENQHENRTYRRFYRPVF